METSKQPWDTYINYLELKGLSAESISAYMFYWQKFNWPLNQESLNEFLTNNKSSNARAFIKNYIKCFKVQGVELPEVTGRELRKKKVPKVISKQDVYSIMRLMPNIMYKVMVLLSFQGGLRLKELLAIKPFDFRWRKWKEDPSQPLELVVSKGKGNKQRTVFISSKVASATHNYIVKYRAMFSKEMPIFPLHKRTWQEHIYTASNKALGYKISPHVFRHSCATYLLNVLHWNIKEVQEYLGHSDLNATQIYVHVSNEDMKQKFSF